MDVPGRSASQRTTPLWNCSCLSSSQDLNCLSFFRINATCNKTHKVYKHVNQVNTSKTNKVNSLNRFEHQSIVTVPSQCKLQRNVSIPLNANTDTATFIEIEHNDPSLVSMHKFVERDRYNSSTSVCFFHENDVLRRSWKCKIWNVDFPRDNVQIVVPTVFRNYLLQLSHLDIPAASNCVIARTKQRLAAHFIGCLWRRTSKTMAWVVAYINV